MINVVAYACTLSDVQTHKTKIYKKVVTFFARRESGHVVYGINFFHYDMPHEIFHAHSKHFDPDNTDAAINGLTVYTHPVQQCFLRALCNLHRGVLLYLGSM